MLSSTLQITLYIAFLKLGYLPSSVYDSEIFPSNFFIYSKDRSSRGGGVLIAIRKTIPRISRVSPKDLEIVAINININSNKPITVLIRCKV